MANSYAIPSDSATKRCNFHRHSSAVSLGRLSNGFMCSLMLVFYNQSSRKYETEVVFDEFMTRAIADM
jgi:hypothetical protein